MTVMRPGESQAESIPGMMKWYGWGTAQTEFDAGSRPSIWPYVTHHLGIGPDGPRTPPVPLDALTLPPPRLPPGFAAAAREALPTRGFSVETLDRVVHAYGKSTRDLWRIRHGRLDAAPDAVAFPETEDQVVALLRLADRFNVAVIPFGGGSNVAGCLEVLAGEDRPVLSVNLRRMNRVLALDTVSGTVRAQPGLLGPELEAHLETAGMTLGHFPDSFLYSTLGGWVATRSSGMMSDTYGNIDDMVIGLRMVTPSGVVATRAVPRASNGPDANRLCIGSEGTLGIMTELTMRIRPRPQRREIRAYLFPSFKHGIDALRTSAQSDGAPTFSRLNDPAKTQLSAAFRRDEGRLKAWLGQGFKAYLKSVRGFDFGNACLMVAAFQGTPRDIRWRRRATETIYRRFGAAALGRGPGQAFFAGKYDFPHIRDFLLDHGVICDVAETSIPWSGMERLYARAMAEIGAALSSEPRPTWLGCHVSHSYPVGASLYFSFAFRCDIAADGTYDPERELAFYAAIKAQSLACFSDNGATLSHHHAVGYEHLPWLARESAVGARSLIDTVKDGFDPRRIMNPGKLTARFTESDLHALLRRPGDGETAAPPATSRQHTQCGTQ